MFRRSGWFVLFVIVAVATFFAEPGATAEFAWDAFRAVGVAGGEVVAEFTSDDPAEGVG